jgi:hypothetical protein
MYSWFMLKSSSSMTLMFDCFMVFNTTFNNISPISWRLVVLREKTGGPGENHRPVTDKLYHLMLYTSPWSRFELTTSVVTCTGCIGSYKSFDHGHDGHCTSFIYIISMYRTSYINDNNVMLCIRYMYFCVKMIVSSFVASCVKPICKMLDYLMYRIWQHECQIPTFLMATGLIENVLNAMGDEYKYVSLK